MILNQSQAEAVYTAMCALNNVSGTIKVTLPLGRGNATARDCIRVFEDDGMVKVNRIEDFVIDRHEVYDNQAAFVTAYGLDHGDEAQSAVAAAAGGLTQTAIER